MSPPNEMEIGNNLAKVDALAKTQRMAKQKFRPTRHGGFSGAKAYIRYVEVLKKRRNAVGRTFCDAIKVTQNFRNRQAASTFSFIQPL
jgi:hypothetical protein